MINKFVLGIGAMAAGVTTVMVGVVAANPEVATSEVGAAATDSTLSLRLTSPSTDNYWSSAKADYYIHLFGGTSTGTTWPGIKLGQGSGDIVLEHRVTASEASVITGYTHCIITRWEPGRTSDWSEGNEWGRWDYFSTNSMSPEQYNYFTYQNKNSCSSARYDEPEGENNYIYVVDKSDRDLNAYSFGGSTTLGSWPGTLLSENSKTVSFWGQKLKRVAISKASTDSQILFNCAGQQTSDLVLLKNCIYEINDDWSIKTLGDYEVGKAAAVAWEVSEVLNNAAASEDHPIRSVCNVSSEEATRVVNLYKALGNKQPINEATIKTWSADGSSEESTVKLKAIVEQLASIAGIEVSSANVINPFVESDSTIVVTIIAASAATVMAGGYFLARKRKHN